MVVVDRDYNGARGIFLRALGASPLLRRVFDVASYSECIGKFSYA